MKYVYKSRDRAEKNRNSQIHCLSPQVLPPFLGTERSVLQCDGLLRPGEYAQVSVKAAPLLFLVLVQEIKRKRAKLVKQSPG